MWKIKNIIALILSIVGICISLVQFLVRDNWGSKVFVLVYLIVFVYFFIVTVKDSVKNCKQ